MFAFFVSGIFYNFWGNQPGDIFFQNTCTGMEWEPSVVTLIHFPGFKKYAAQELTYHWSNNNKTLELRNASGDVVDVLNGVAYYENGQMLVTC